MRIGMAEMKPSIIAIFGASGDLAHIKIFPALYSLWEDGFFPDNFFYRWVCENKV